MNFQQFSNQTDFENAATTEIKSSCQKPKPKIALSGGSTPETIYKKLAKQKDLDFPKIEFFIVDERYVAPDHKKSNYKMIKNALPKNTKIHYFNTSLPIKNSLKIYEKILPEKFDLCVLGIGPDGHIASLFPNTKALNEQIHLTAHTQTKQFDIVDRLTLTYPAILNSKKLLLLLKGEEKKEILEKLLYSNENPHSLPAKKLLEHKNLIIFFKN